MKKENILTKSLGLGKTTRILTVTILVLAIGLLFNLDKTAFGQYGGGGGSTGITPANPSISINNGAANTTSATVTLTLGATNATAMAISNNASFTGVSYETYSATKEWTLTSGAGTKTVYAKFRNSNDSAVVSDTIAYSATPATPAEPATPGQEPATPATPATPPSYTDDGTLLKVSDAPEVYVIVNGKRVWIKSIEEFNAGGYNWADIKTVSSETLSQISSSVVLIRAEGDVKVYVVENGKKRHIASAEAFNAAGYNWGDIREVSAKEANGYADETTSSVVLIRVAGDVKVYIVENGKKRHIASAEAFNAAGYNWGDIREVSAEETSNYPDASPAAIIVNTAWLRVRASNNTNSGILGLVYNGETYNILEELDGWYKIESKVGIGWVSGDYVKK